MHRGAVDVLRAIYSLLILLAVPLIVLRLYWRGRFEPRYREHIGERFAQFTQPALKGRSGCTRFQWVKCGRQNRWSLRCA